MQGYRSVKTSTTSSTIVVAKIVTICGHCGEDVPMSLVNIATQHRDHYEANEGVVFYDFRDDKYATCPGCGLVNGLSPQVVDQVRQEAMERLGSDGALEWSTCRRCYTIMVPTGSTNACPSCGTVEGDAP